MHVYSLGAVHFKLRNTHRQFVFLVESCFSINYFLHTLEGVLSGLSWGILIGSSRSLNDVMIWVGKDILHFDNQIQFIFLFGRSDIFKK